MEYSVVRFSKGRATATPAAAAAVIATVENLMAVEVGM